MLRAEKIPKASLSQRVMADHSCKGTKPKGCPMWVYISHSVLWWKYSHDTEVAWFVWVIKCKAQVNHISCFIVRLGVTIGVNPFTVFGFLRMKFYGLYMRTDRLDVCQYIYIVNWFIGQRPAWRVSCIWWLCADIPNYVLP